jgi:putative transposase
VGIFPNPASIRRLVGAVLAEQNDERVEAHRDTGPEILVACRKLGANESEPRDTTEH